MKKSTGARNSWVVRVQPGTNSGCARSASGKGGLAVGKTVKEAEALLPEQRIFIERIRRNGKITDATTETVIRVGDIVAVAGRREVLVNLIGSATEEVDDRELLAAPIEGLDVYVTSKEFDGKTLAQLANSPGTRGRTARRFGDRAWFSIRLEH